MNAAEKAQLAKRKAEDAKRQRKMRLIARTIKTVEALFLAASAVVILMIVVYSETKNLTALAKWAQYAKWALIADAVGAVVGFYMGLKETDAAKTEHLTNFVAALICVMFVLGIALIGANGMVNKG